MSYIRIFIAVEAAHLLEKYRPLLEEYEKAEQRLSELRARKKQIEDQHGALEYLADRYGLIVYGIRYRLTNDVPACESRTPPEQPPAKATAKQLDGAEVSF